MQEATRAPAGSAKRQGKASGRVGFAALALGVLAGIGGFLDTGGVITAVSAGARFNFALIWTVVFGLVAHGQTALIAWIGVGLSVIGALSSGLRRPSL